MKKTLPAEQAEELLKTLKVRFEKNMGRHKSAEWTKLQTKLESAPEKLWSLYEMEKTGGEPDVVEYDEEANAFTFCDCSAESPVGRRSLCYDREALEARKQNKPEGSVIDMAADIGIAVLTEEQYRRLQEVDSFDLKTSSWVATPAEMRKLGGALFCDKRYDRVFTYHNGADSYYAARGFRGFLEV